MIQDNPMQFDPADYGFHSFSHSHAILVGRNTFLRLSRTGGGGFYDAELYKPFEGWKKHWLGGYYVPQTTYLPPIATEAELITLYGALTGRILTKQAKYVQSIP